MADESKAPTPKTEAQRDHVLQFFTFNHLPEDLKAVSKPFADLANHLVSHLPRNPERTKMLNKLLEAKDCAVRALVAKDTL